MLLRVQTTLSRLLILNVTPGLTREILKSLLGAADVQTS